MLSLEKTLSHVPLVQIKSFLPQNEVFSLLEKYNLCGSIKSKTVYRILKTAIEDGKLDQNKIILEASSGNTAIALAFFGSVMGFQVHIVVPKSTAPCKKRLITSYGAKIIEIEGITDDCIRHRDELFANAEEKYYLPNQFTNFANFWAHYHLTGKHIREKLGKNLDFFCTGLGTSGTLLGTAKYLKEQNPNIKIIALNPVEKIEGLRNFKTTNVQIPFFEKYKNLIDETIDLTDEDVKKGIKLYLNEGYFVGISSGAIVSGTERRLKNKKENQGLTGVIIAPDGGDFYLESMKKYVDLGCYTGCENF